jgi:ribosome maturation factor RimP
VSSLRSGRKPTFLLHECLKKQRAEGNREAVTEKVRDITERVAADAGLEVVDVQLLGGGQARLLRIYIDKPEGVSHADCEYITQHVGTILDVEDVIPGSRYTLEVSSPGVERKLTKPREFERFIGQKVKVVLREPVENQRHWVGALTNFAEGIITLEPSPGRSVQFPLEQVERANLKFEW